MVAGEVRVLSEKQLKAIERERRGLESFAYDKFRELHPPKLHFSKAEGPRRPPQQQQQGQLAAQVWETAGWVGFGMRILDVSKRFGMTVISSDNNSI